MDGIIQTTIPHADFGAPHCCGCLKGVLHGDGGQADIICNECGLIVRTVSAADLERMLDEMELELDIATAQCPHCGAVHVAPGVSKLLAFVCDECGHGVTLADKPGRN